MMKKILITLMALLAISASCFAAGASKNFAAEEKAADAFTAALLNNGAFATAQAGVASNINEKGFVEAQKQIKEKIGRISDVNFVLYQKNYDVEKAQYGGAEELVYVGKVVGKPDQVVRINVVFAPENGKQKIVNFFVNVLTLQKQDNAKK
ncbi:MAG: hypothetical protein SOU14_00495 [Succiniclasticum sp.]|nr:hypothetical protein [Succiniclasticum sp.]